MTVNLKLDYKITPKHQKWYFFSSGQVEVDTQYMNLNLLLKCPTHGGNKHVYMPVEQKIKQKLSMANFLLLNNSILYGGGDGGS